MKTRNLGSLTVSEMGLGNEIRIVLWPGPLNTRRRCASSVAPMTWESPPSTPPSTLSGRPCFILTAPFAMRCRGAIDTSDLAPPRISEAPPPVNCLD
jgi:hypothetical protein